MSATPYAGAERVLSYTLPEAYWRAAYQAFYRVRRAGWWRLLQANAALRNRHAGARVFVIGNGPSLATQDLKPLRNEVTIVANGFFLHPEREAIAPKYWCVGDPSFVSGDAKSVGFLREIEGALPDPVLFFRPVARELFAREKLFAGRAVHFIDTGYRARRPEDVRVDLTQLVNVGNTTGCSFSIPLALWLGAREIVLLGFDANWLEDEKKSRPHFYVTNRHFPEFDKMYNPGSDVEDQLRAMHLDFMGHRMLGQLARRRGARILNATAGGWLDMHERVSYESVVGGR